MRIGIATGYLSKSISASGSSLAAQATGSMSWHHLPITNHARTVLSLPLIAPLLLLSAISDAAAGGQILTCSQTFRAIKDLVWSLANG